VSPEPGPFAAFYASPLQHPILLWLAAGAALLWCATRRGLEPSLRRYCFALVALSVADAWLTGNHVYGLGALPPWAAGTVPLGFVLAGDFRFLLLICAATDQGGIEPSARRLLAAAGLTLLVPIASQLVVRGLPEALGSQPRVLFLTYETGFVLLVLALLRWHPRVRSVAWLGPVGRFVLLYYALWASADAILLVTGSDLGFLLRVLPNLLYYGGLIAAIGQAGARAVAQAGPGSDRKAATAAFQAPGSSK
jgi:hypothetical protein